MKVQLRSALAVFVLSTVVTGVVYPLLVTLVAQVAFPHAANGSLIVHGGRTVGSELIGQAFDDPRYFWGRPSATSPTSYNAASSSGSNIGPTNPALIDAVRLRVDLLRKTHPDQLGPIPVDLVTTSASGLDPHISPSAAEFQVPRVAKARSWEIDRVRRLVVDCTVGRTLGVLGEPRVNVLRLNLALDEQR